MIFQKKTRSSLSGSHIWCLVFCLVSLLCVGTASANTKSATPQYEPKYSVPARQQFKLSKTIFVTADFEHRNTATDFAKWLRSQGVAASNAYNKASHRITFVKANSIEGASGDNAWHINVKSKRVTVTFTTSVSLQNSLAMLKSMVARGASGVEYIPGGTTADWGAQTATSDKGDRTQADAASSMQPISNLETTLKRLAGESNEVYLILISADKWRMQSPSLEAADLTKQLYPTDGYYNVSQLRRIAQVAQKNKIEIIPTLELCSENRAFTTAFGHSIFSVEGMRLVRATIEDCIEVLNPSRICIGTMSSETDMRYMKFISDLAIMLGVELIIIEQ